MLENVADMRLRRAAREYRNNAPNIKSISKNSPPIPPNEAFSAEAEAAASAFAAESAATSSAFIPICNTLGVIVGVRGVVVAVVVGVVVVGGGVRLCITLPPTAVWEDVGVIEFEPVPEDVIVLDEVPVEESVPELLAVLLGDEPGDNVDVGVGELLAVGVGELESVPLGESLLVEEREIVLVPVSEGAAKSLPVGVGVRVGVLLSVPVADAVLEDDKPEDDGVGEIDVDGEGRCEGVEEKTQEGFATARILTKTPLYCVE